MYGKTLTSSFYPDNGEWWELEMYTYYPGSGGTELGLSMLFTEQDAALKMYATLHRRRHSIVNLLLLGLRHCTYGEAPSRMVKEWQRDRHGFGQEYSA